jgi:hypothetical protein
MSARILTMKEMICTTPTWSNILGFSDLLAARELIPVERGETVRQWVERCYLAGVIGGFEMEKIRNQNQHLWHTPYMIEPNKHLNEERQSRNARIWANRRKRWAQWKKEQDNSSLDAQDEIYRLAHVNAWEV